VISRQWNIWLTAAFQPRASRLARRVRRAQLPTTTWLLHQHPIAVKPLEARPTTSRMIPGHANDWFRSVVQASPIQCLHLAPSGRLDSSRLSI
jgi:hypothetical protein